MESLTEMAVPIRVNTHQCDILSDRHVLVSKKKTEMRRGNGKGNYHVGRAHDRRTSQHDVTDLADIDDIWLVRDETGPIAV